MYSMLDDRTEIQTLTLVHALQRGQHNVTVACYFEFSPSMVLRYQEAGARVICFSASGKRFSGLQCIRFLFLQLKATIKKVKPDIVHVQYMAPGAIPILFLRLLGITNLLATTHTTADIYKSLKLIHIIQQHCVRAFICITQTAENSYFGTSKLYQPEIALKKRNHFTIYNALPSHISIRQEKRDFQHPITIGVVSRLEYIKGMDLVIPVFARILQKADCKLLVVGEGSVRPVMEQQANELGCNTAITWYGRQEGCAIQSIYDRIDILLVPSRSEGFGLTALEGMARGCVVVASDIGGLSEIIRDGIDGMLHESEKIKDISRKVAALLHSPEKMNRLSVAATQRAENFSFNYFSKQYNDLYNKLSTVCYS